MGKYKHLEHIHTHSSNCYTCYKSYLCLTYVVIFFTVVSGMITTEVFHDTISVVWDSAVSACSGVVYVVTVLTVNGHLVESFVATSNQFTLTNLMSSTDYTISVSVANQYGNGSRPAYSIAVTTLESPSMLIYKYVHLYTNNYIIMCVIFLVYRHYFRAKLKCDWACENRTFGHNKILIWLYFSEFITFKLIIIVMLFSSHIN